ncbi:DUF2953 domain-containing protein [Cytobacillus depressus]|uniref:DUF2953 domain-containing protein n=1 Tax=Cytobacillus depressus TaxID=1602942 RepID=A0A6L3VB02_9BACI|nr:DUF2953 domain-containing protein [Cytobacillus depressus]KAB2338838.1 DUF2953 domain-containing protein [Cytobacillus depressus]
MKWVLIAIIIFVIIFITILFSKLKVYFRYDHLNDDDHIKVEFRAWFGLIRYKIEMPLIKIDDNSPTVVVKQEKSMKQESVNKDTKQFGAQDLLNYFHDVKAILHSVVSLNRIIKKFLRKVTIRQFDWHTSFGLGDAAYTGMFTGAFWAMKGSIIGVISHFMKLKTPPNLSITPQFQFALSQTSISCIFYFRIGHAMLAGIKLMKYWKGGRTIFRTKSLSALSNNKTKSM